MASGFVRKSDKGELSTCRHGRPQVACRLLHKSALLLVFGLVLWKWMTGVDSTDSNQEYKIGYKNLTSGVARCLASTRKLGESRSSEGLRCFKSSNGTNFITLLLLAGDIEMNPQVPVLSLGNVRAASQRVCELQICEYASCKSASLRVESLRVTSFERKNYLRKLLVTHIYHR